MGYSSWNDCASEITEARVKNITRAAWAATRPRGEGLRPDLKGKTSGLAPEQKKRLDLRGPRQIPERHEAVGRAALPALAVVAPGERPECQQEDPAASSGAQLLVAVGMADSAATAAASRMGEEGEGLRRPARCSCAPRSGAAADQTPWTRTEREAPVAGPPLPRILAPKRAVL